MKRSHLGHSLKKYHQISRGRSCQDISHDLEDCSKSKFEKVVEAMRLNRLYQEDPQRLPKFKYPDSHADAKQRFKEIRHMLSKIECKPAELDKTRKLYSHCEMLYLQT